MVLILALFTTSFSIYVFVPSPTTCRPKQNYAVSMFVRTKGVYIHGFQGRISFRAACGKAGARPLSLAKKAQHQNRD
jgi:hypothetical protein